jgi:hypothetical protein
MKQEHAACADIFRVTEFSSLLKCHSKKHYKNIKNGEEEEVPRARSDRAVYLNDQKMTTTLTLT